MGIRGRVFFREEGSWWEKVGWNGIGDKLVDMWIGNEREFWFYNIIITLILQLVSKKTT